MRVVEICQIAAGPYCAMLLADLGADVVKVEPPEGDAMRAWPPLSRGYSENFASLNRNKRSIALNLRNPVDSRVALQLIESADIVVENSRPGALARLGLDHASVGNRRPALVYCSISAFGQTGPRSADGGFDLTLQAASGIMSVTGEPEGPSVKAGVPITDFATGLYAALSIVALLLRVRSGGVGGHLDVPMIATSLAVSALQASEYFGTGLDPKPLGSAHPRNAPYQAFAASDGRFVIAAGNDRLWRKVCEVIGRTELAADPRFRSPALRAQHQRALSDELSPALKQRDLNSWLAAFRTAGVPCEPINAYSAALAEAQVQHLGLIQALTLANGVATRTVGPPVAVPSAPFTLRPPPALDADRADILAELARLVPAGARR